jgi:hypothetical protein
MKRYSHAWVALQSVERLEQLTNQFDGEHKKSIKNFLEFISHYPSTFVRGAWFPDDVIKDNIRGGHTWKYSLDEEKGRKVKYRPPSNNYCLNFVKDDLHQKVLLDKRYSFLPDRCEALSQTIRDAIKITNYLDSGDVLVFNDSQIAAYYLMLSHYVADAHVPVHCDKRDFYDPSHVHDDLESFWENEILKFYKVSDKYRQFDLDENQKLQCNKNNQGFEESILKKCLDLLGQSKWEVVHGRENNWRAFLGKKNNNLWDYLVGVCLISFHISLDIFPKNEIDPGDNAIRIMDTNPFKERIMYYSPYILADAIDSVAIAWLATWERWELLEKGLL